MILPFKRKLISASRWQGGLEIKWWHFSVLVFLVVATAMLLAGGAAAQTPCDTADALFKAQLYEDAQTNYTALLKQNSTLTCAQNGSLEVQRAEANESYELGRAYENASQVKEARDAYVDALKKYPTFGDAQKALARLNGGILTLAYTLYMWLLPALEYIAVGAIVLLAFLLVILVPKFKIYPWIMGFKRPSLHIAEFDKGATGLEIGKGLGAMVEDSYNTLGHESRMRVNLVEGTPDKFEIPADVKVAPYFKLLSDLIDWLFPPYVITLSGYLQKPGSLGSGVTVTLVVNRTKKILGSCTIWQNELYLETTPKKAEESIDPTSYYRLAEPTAIWVLFQLGNQSKKDKKEKFTMMGTNDWQSYAYFKAGVRWQLDGKLDKAQQLYVESLDSSDMKNWGTLLNLGRMEMEEGQYQHAFERLKMAKEKTIFDKAYKSEKYMDFPRNHIWYLATYSLALTYCYLSKRYESNLNKAKETKTLRDTINKSIDARQKKDKMMLEYNLSMFEAEAKTLFELIQNAKDDMQIAEKISKLKAVETAHDLIDRIKKSVDTIRESLKASQKNEEMVDPSNEVDKIEKAINDELKLKNKSAPFVFIMYQAEEEAKNLVYAIKKAIGKPMKVHEAKKLADMIQEAIDTQQEKEDMYTSKAKELVDKLVYAIKKPIWPRRKNDEKEFKEFLESLYPMACIMYADTLLYLNDDEKARKEIIDDIKPYSLPYRGRYNLACYYSIVGEKETEENKQNAYRESLCHLEYALERGGGIVDWANKDPDLGGVREYKETKEEFAKLMKKYAPQETPHSSDLPLAEIAIIGEAYAKQLKENEIVSYCDLILKADTSQGREALAKKLGISTKLLHRWVHVADLMRIVGDTKNVNLLEAADYSSIEALSKVSDPCELANLLNQINKAMSLVSQTPSIETVHLWVQEAKKPEFKVSQKH